MIDEELNYGVKYCRMVGVIGELQAVFDPFSQSIDICFLKKSKYNKLWVAEARVTLKASQ